MMNLFDTNPNLNKILPESNLVGSPVWLPCLALGRTLELYRVSLSESYINL